MSSQHSLFNDTVRNKTKSHHITLPPPYANMKVLFLSLYLSLFFSRFPYTLRSIKQLK